MAGRTPIRVPPAAALALAVLAGCHALRQAAPSLRPAVYPDLLAPPVAAELPLARVLPVQPDVSAVSPADAREAPFAPRDRAGVPFRQLLEADCEKLARDAAALRPPVGGDAQCGPEGAAFWREVRGCLAAEARNRAVGEALEAYYRLADAECRRDAAVEMLAGVDDLRATAKEARTVGVAAPVSADDLDRQRGSLVALLTEADLGADLLTIDLKRRLALDGRTSDRLWPVGVFAVTPGAVDVEKAVADGIARRGDLQLLRATLRRLTPDTVASVRDLMRERIAGVVPDPLAGFPVLHRLSARRTPEPPAGELDAAVHAEVIALRQVLADTLAVREKQVEAEVRAAARTLAARERQVALARGALARAEESKASASGRGPLLAGAAKLEAEKAKAELAAAAFAWHQARAKLRAAKGELGGE